MSSADLEQLRRLEDQQREQLHDEVRQQYYLITYIHGFKTVAST